MKERITISVEPEVVQMAREEVELGRASSVSAAIEDAVVRRKRSRALREAVELWEDEFGPIGEEAKEWARKGHGRDHRSGGQHRSIGLDSSQRSRSGLA
jgi:Arc/MetJ-type ribon-helix-helix transcriptional regulator